MPLFKRWTSRGACWGIWKVTEAPDELRGFLSDSLDYDKELGELKSVSRKVEYLAVRVLLKELMGEEYRIAHYVSGKPYLPDNNLSLTISHTRGYVAVGVCREDAVPGIDIEYYAERVGKVASRFMRPDELPESRECTERQRLYGLLLHWSAKETIYKVLGQKEVDFKKHLRVFPFSLSEQGCFIGIEYRTVRHKVFRIDYMIHPDFVCTWCVDCNEVL